MTRFRHGVLVNTTNHGSGVAEYDIVQEQGEEWTRVLPEREYSRLTHDARRNGFENVPSVLFGREKASTRMDEEGRVWYANFVIQEELYYRTLHSPDWFFRKYSERQIAISDCKAFIEEIIAAIEEDAMTPSNIVKYLKKWRDINSNLIPYLFLTLMTDEFIINDLRSILVEHANGKIANSVILDLLESEYAKNAMIGGYSPNKSWSFSFPPEEYYYPEGKVVLNRTIAKESQVLEELMKVDTAEYWRLLDTYFRYRIVTPLVAQLNEEKFYVGRSLQIAINHVLDSLGEKLLDTGEINSKSEMTDMELEPLVDKASSLV